ncbi:GAP family protein [Streptomyces lutosisoli]|uniref:GAP family protein n=1 Tax=Streptomyces lutosisoli TaxID=2665721 RepID=A0ABW2VT37_9ACTN
MEAQARASARWQYRLPPLTIAAGASIASAGLPVGQQIASLAIFVLIGSLGLLAPLGVFLVGGERA